MLSMQDGIITKTLVMNKIYAIFYDNNESWEDHNSGICTEHIYSDFEIAHKICNDLNHPVYIEPTHEDWVDFGNSSRAQWSWKEFLEEHKESWDNRSKCTYTVVPLEVK